MKVTEKQRADIAMSIGELSIKDAEKIAQRSGKSTETVYRLLKLIRTPNAVIDTENDVILELIELAAKRKPVLDQRAERLKKSMMQLSAKPPKQAA
jgi:CO dehydrogenase/acetyl-CoA synthase beta subunit